MARMTEADVAYVRAEFLTLEQACGGRADSADEVRSLIGRRLLPAPSYVLEDGTEMVPADYFALADEAGGPERLRSEFERRYRLAPGADPAELEDDWRG